MGRIYYLIKQDIFILMNLKLLRLKNNTIFYVLAIIIAFSLLTKKYIYLKYLTQGICKFIKKLTDYPLIYASTFVS